MPPPTGTCVSRQSTTNDLARRLHQAGYDLYLLSNAGVRFDRAKGRIPVLPLLSGWVVSAYEHLMKPDPAIYALLCQRYGLEPSACLFVDDSQDNVEDARRAGMSAYRFTTAEQTSRRTWKTSGISL